MKRGRARATAAFRADVDRWAERLRVRPRAIQIRPMKRKWASCSSAGRLCFSRELLRQKNRFREVVIVHELLHLRVPNHGKLFRSLMNAHVPRWRKVLDVEGWKCR
ncbi:MAG: M48 metallopeptidase family protein [Candidatus Binatia bacterium]